VSCVDVSVPKTNDAQLSLFFFEEDHESPRPHPVICHLAHSAVRQVTVFPLQAILCIPKRSAGGSGRESSRQIWVGPTWKPLPPEISCL